MGYALHSPRCFPMEGILMHSLAIEKNAARLGRVAKAEKTKHRADAGRERVSALLGKIPSFGETNI